MSRPVSAVRYGCSMRGRCERDEVNGRYTSLEDCERECQGAESADLIYLILSYDWEAATTAPPSDQQYLLYLEFGLRVSPAEAVRVVKLLATGHIYELLLTSPVFEDYLSASLSDFTIFALEVVFLYSQVADVTITDWQAFEQELRQRTFYDQWGERDRSALNIPVINELMREYHNVIYLGPAAYNQLWDELHYLIASRHETS